MFSRRTLLASTSAVAIGGLAACSSNGGEASNGDEAVNDEATGNVEFWAWQAGLDEIVARYNESQSDIQVTLNAVPSGPDAYQRLESAVNAGTAPDLAQVEFQQIPTFAVSGVLQDVTEHTGQYESNYPEWAWSHSGFLDQHYGIPNDQGPIVTYANQSILDDAGAEFPETWPEFRTLAETLRSELDVQIGTLLAQGGLIAGLAAQNGARWFEAGDDSWTVEINDDATREVLNFWTGMAHDDLVALYPGMNTGFWSELDAGGIATQTIGIWGFKGMKGNLSQTAGLWHAYESPKWPDHPDLNGYNGGSSWAIPSGASNPAAALKFANWLASDSEAMNLQSEHSGYYPASNNADDVVAFTEPDEFFGGQVLNEVFEPAADAVDQGWNWGPVMSRLFSLLEDGLPAAVERGDADDLLDSIQEDIVSTMESSGFSVAD